VRNARVQTFANRTALIDLCIDVRDKKQLDQVQSQLRQLSDVLVLRSRHYQNGSR
jgi:(p)ppGpp synthase/HD superfamily hydrolase